jgi:hypothetical protein
MLMSAKGGVGLSEKHSAATPGFVIGIGKNTFAQLYQSGKSLLLVSLSAASHSQQRRR